MIQERDVRRYPPDPEGLLAALREARKLQARVKAIVDKLPRPFQLDIDDNVLYVPFSLRTVLVDMYDVDQHRVGKRYCATNSISFSRTRWRAKRPRMDIWS